MKDIVKIVTISAVLCFILFAVLFEGSTTALYAEDILLSSFGVGQIKVRLYTDYFCNPCRALEPKLEPLIATLVKKSIINIMFIDTPLHPETPLYTKYFLYILNEKHEFDYALRARVALFEAAKNHVKEKEKLEAFLKKRV